MTLGHVIHRATTMGRWEHVLTGMWAPGEEGIRGMENLMTRYAKNHNPIQIEKFFKTHRWLNHRRDLCQTNRSSFHCVCFCNKDLPRELCRREEGRLTPHRQVRPTYPSSAHAKIDFTIGVVCGRMSNQERRKPQVGWPPSVGALASTPSRMTSISSGGGLTQRLM